MNNFKRICYRHLVCIIIYLISIFALLIIGIATACYGGKNNEMVSYIGFAGTLISIILSVIAIIYAFAQTMLSSSFISSLQDAAKRIFETTDRFNDAQSAFKASIDKLEKKVSDFHTDLQKNFSYQGIKETQKPPAQSDIVKNFINKGSNAGNIAFLLCVLQSKRPKISSLPELLDKISTDSTQLFRNYCIGYIICLGAFEIIVTNGPNNNPWSVKCLFNSVGEIEKYLIDDLRNKNDENVLKWLNALLELYSE